LPFCFAFSSIFQQVHEDDGCSIVAAARWLTEKMIATDGGTAGWFEVADAEARRWTVAGGVTELRSCCGGDGSCAICGGASEEDARNWCRFVVAGCVNGGCRSCAVVCGLSFAVARWWFVCGRLR